MKKYNIEKGNLAHEPESKAPANSHIQGPPKKANSEKELTLTKVEGDDQDNSGLERWQVLMEGGLYAKSPGCAHCAHGR
jgi:hypothetical protein